MGKMFKKNISKDAHLNHKPTGAEKNNTNTNHSLYNIHPSRTSSDKGTPPLEKSITYTEDVENGIDRKRYTLGDLRSFASNLQNSTYTALELEDLIIGMRAWRTNAEVEIGGRPQSVYQGRKYMTPGHVLILEKIAEIVGTLERRLEREKEWEKARARDDMVVVVVEKKEEGEAKGFRIHTLEDILRLARETVKQRFTTAELDEIVPPMRAWLVEAEAEVERFVGARKDGRMEVDDATRERILMVAEIQNIVVRLEKRLGKKASKGRCCRGKLVCVVMRDWVDGWIGRK